MNKQQIKTQIKNRYSQVAQKGRPKSLLLRLLCNQNETPNAISKKIGYSDKELNTLTQEENLGLGCGNPTALASIKKGETILDLGCGAGFDCFLASRKTGVKGKVIGIDMSSEMVKRAQEIAAKNNFTNVSFIEGDIEKLPIKSNSVDLIISNCVIHLSTNTEKVFQEAFRVLKPGGRLMISDLALVQKLPFFIEKAIGFYVHYIPEMKLKQSYLTHMKQAGFQNIKVMNEIPFPIDAWLLNPTIKCLFNKYVPQRCKDIAKRVVSIKVSATKIIN